MVLRFFPWIRPGHRGRDGGAIPQRDQLRRGVRIPQTEIHPLVLQCFELAQNLWKLNGNFWKTIGKPMEWK